MLLASEVQSLIYIYPLTLSNAQLHSYLSALCYIFCKILPVIFKFILWIAFVCFTCTLFSKFPESHGTNKFSCMGRSLFACEVIDRRWPESFLGKFLQLPDRITKHRIDRNVGISSSIWYSRGRVRPIMENKPLSYMLKAWLISCRKNHDTRCFIFFSFS